MFCVANSGTPDETIKDRVYGGIFLFPQLSYEAHDTSHASDIKV